MRRISGSSVTRGAPGKGASEGTGTGAGGSTGGARGVRSAGRGKRKAGVATALGDGAGPGSTGQARAEQGAAGKGRGADRANLYDEVTGKIIAQLEAGRFPWVQPWGKVDVAGCGAAVGLPRNAVSQRAYSGVNVLILWGAVIEGGYPTQDWLTFKQAIEAGGNVRKGEKGVTVVYADRFTPETEKARAQESGEDARSIPFLKRFTVFNLAQCDGLDDSLIRAPAPLPERQIAPVADAVIAASGVDFRVGGDKAFYSPGADFVQVPPPMAFFQSINWYRTALHELTHATGHTSRLARDQKGKFGSADYAREELVAELGSAYLCAALGIVPTVRHADYLASWLEVLRDDNRAIFRAASQASKAADWLLTHHEEAKAAAMTLPETGGSIWGAPAGEWRAAA